ncbi:MAG: bifunctional phosphopantothenoylcysteine decarboxylase/phosphopantothenate--cysteine ligase CoaBC [Bacteroidota bacterium]|jgi:phosphopantothenoylcysteine decarboxylase/phosphopantothenate--cysteine ligase
MLRGKKILLGITGSITAYKSILLLRCLLKEGAAVKIILTPSAKNFVTPLTLATLSKNEVLVELFDEATWANHVMLGRWADIMIIAPLSCNTLAKMAQGHCDNLLLATYLSATCPVIVAPAMDEDMWHHPSTKNNLNTLATFGHKIIPVDKGELASGLVGDGRMAEPEAIITFIKKHFFTPSILKGKKALVTAGPTYEPIDPVRFIGNHSSGKMGIAIANELHEQGADVTLILGPVMTNNLALPNVNIIDVNTAAQMYAACMGIYQDVDICIMAAAVADYTPIEVASQKIKKAENDFSISLTRTKDILLALGENKKQNQVLVGFALETVNEKEYAKGKLEKKNADMIVLNSLNDNGAGFGLETNKITIFTRSGQELNFEAKSKSMVAKDIIDTIIRFHYV